MTTTPKNAGMAAWAPKAGVIAILSLSLAACSSSGLRDTLGYGKTAPDEFSIVTKAPLVMPPDFSLRPPQPGAPRPQELQPTEGAQAALIGERDTAATTQVAAATQGEQILLQQTGASQADPRIRQVVNAETRSLVEQDKTFVDDVLFWRKAGTPPDERLVNPREETQRIQQNEAEGKEVTDGETPTVTPKKEGWLSGIF